jgi:hypothetical protein
MRTVQQPEPRVADGLNDLNRIVGRSIINHDQFQFAPLLRQD